MGRARGDKTKQKTYSHGKKKKKTRHDDRQTEIHLHTNDVLFYQHVL